MYLPNASSLYKSLLCTQMHPVILSEGAVSVDALLSQGVNRRWLSVWNSTPWTGSQSRMKTFSDLGFSQMSKQTRQTGHKMFSTYSGIRKGSRKYRTLHAVPPASSENDEIDIVSSVTHDPADSNSGMAKKKEKHSLQFTDAEQQPKIQKHLSTLDSYFNKLHSKVDRGQAGAISADPTVVADSFFPALTVEPNPDESTSTMQHAEKQLAEEEEQLKMAKRLDMLDTYFNKLYSGSQDVQKGDIHEKVQKGDIPENDRSNKSRNSTRSEDPEVRREFLEIVKEIRKNLESNRQVESQFGEKLQQSFEDERQALNGLISPYDRCSNPYLISTLAAINIAVFLFELASPVRSSDMGISSLPLMYGAKINELILDGEWWRLITPMFLHAGLFHVAFSSWALLTFGPLVDLAYGSFAFCMIYFLGGVCGNIMSFFHTPDATIGGTGPVFAIIASWVVYLIQNREKLGEEIVGSMMQKVVVTSALSLALSFLTPIDDWTHLGAVGAGLIFGGLVCPSVPVNMPFKRIFYDPNDNSQKGFNLVSQWPNPRKLFTIFTIFITALFTLFFILAPIITEFHLSNTSDNLF